MRKLILSVLLMGGLSISGFSQDAHFTQYFASPLTLNPALTGLTQSDWRASANFRNQWYTVSSDPGYTTGTLSFDMPLMRGKLPEGDALGVGILGLYDKSGAGGLQNTTIGLSIAYHKAFGSNKQHTLSIGLQGYLVQKSIQFDKLIFPDQYDPSNPSGYLRNTGETFSNTDLTYPDFNAGLLYSGRLSDYATFYAGFSYYHLTRPEESFLSSSSSKNVKINSRYTGYLGGSFQLNENVVTYLSTMYEKQGPAWEYLIGGAVGFVMNPGHGTYQKNTTFYLGAWYRYADAIAPYVGFEWSKMKIGFSYDVTVSSAQAMDNGQGAFEISVIYNGLIIKHPHRRYNFACPKF